MYPVERKYDGVEAGGKLINIIYLIMNLLQLYL